jgi:hypothetical protein
VEPTVGFNHRCIIFAEIRSKATDDVTLNDLDFVFTADQIPIGTANARN